MKKFLNALPTPLDFNLVMWNDSMISETKAAKFQAVMANQYYEQKFHLRLRELYQRDGKIPYTFPNRWSDKEYRDFVIYGVNPIS